MGNPFVQQIQFNPGDPSANAYQVQQAQQLAKMLQEEAMAPIDQPRAPMAKVNGPLSVLSKVLMGYMAGKQQETATDALKQQDSLKQDKINSLTDALTGNTQLQSVDGSPAETVAQHAQMPGDQPFINRDRLVTALGGMGKDDQSQALSNLMMQRALPQKQDPYTLSEGQVRFGPDGKPIASVPDGPKDDLAKVNEDLAHGRITQAQADARIQKLTEGATSFERKTRKLDNNMAQDYNFDPRTGQETLVGKPYKSNESAAAKSLDAAGAPPNEAAVGMILTGMPLTQVAPGFGAAAAKQRETLRNAATDRILQQNPGMSPIDAGQELARRNIDYAASRASGTQLEKMKGATDQAIGQLDFNVDKATEELNKLSSSDLSPVINAIARGADKWTGNKNYASAFFYLHGAALESSRLQSGGQASIAQLNQGAADKAQEWANMGLTPSMWNEVGTAMKAEGRARYQTFQDAYQRQTGRAQDKPPSGKTVVQTGTDKSGKKVVKYSDGTIGYAQP